MFGGVLGALQIPVVANLAPFEAGLAKAEMQAKGAGGGIGKALTGGINPAMIGLAVGIGGATIAIKSILDISDQWEASQKGLKQATDAIGGSYAGAQREVSAFIGTNKRFVGSQSEVVDAYAALLRQGNGTAKAQDDLNLALDLSVVGHKSLTEATTLLQQAEMGRGRALLPLGIQMKEFPILQETVLQATKKGAAAEAQISVIEKALAKDHQAVNDAQIKLTQAVQQHGPKSDQARLATERLNNAQQTLKGNSDKLVVAQAAVAEAHNFAALRAKASAEVHDILHQKLDGGRKSTSDLKQATQDLGNTWQDFAHKAGPPMLGILTGALELASHLIEAIGGVAKKFSDLNNALTNSGFAKAVRGSLTVQGPASTPAGGRFGVIHGATGFEGTVSRPTLFMAGEGGAAEDVSIRPQGVAGGGDLYRLEKLMAQAVGHLAAIRRKPGLAVGL